MKIAIIGAGFTGLATASELVEAGHSVTVFEAASQAGGLAGGFKLADWTWSLENHYHHVFETDRDFRNWLKKFNLDQHLFFKEAETYTLTSQHLAKLDTPMSLLKFPGLSWFSKIRTGASLVFLKIWPWGKFLEKFTAANFCRLTMGKKAWEVLWQPLFVGKFGDQAEQINAAWFWARIHIRSKKLGYYRQGFQQLADEVVKKLSQQGVKFIFQAPIKQLAEIDHRLQIDWANRQQSFDRVLFTGNSDQLLKLASPLLPMTYQQQLASYEFLAAMTLVLVMDHKFFDQPIYWLNINQPNWPFLAVVEHTNLLADRYYKGQKVVYVGKYLAKNESLFKTATAEKLLKIYQPYLEKLSPGFARHVKKQLLFKAEFAQPIVKLNHSSQLPQINTPHGQLFCAGMQQIYPFDRGINYAVKLGCDAAQKILAST